MKGDEQSSTSGRQHAGQILGQGVQGRRVGQADGELQPALFVGFHALGEALFHQDGHLAGLGRLFLGRQQLAQEAKRRPEQLAASRGDLLLSREPGGFSLSRGLLTLVVLSAGSTSGPSFDIS